MTALAQVLPALSRSLRHAHLLDDQQAQSLAESLTRLAEQARNRRFMAALDQALAPVERGFANQLVEKFARLGQHVARVAAQEGGLIVEAADPTRAERGRVSQIVNAAGLGAWARRELKPIYGERYLSVAQRIVETVNTELSLGLMLPDPLAQKIVAEGGRRLGLLDLTADTREALFRIIAQARVEGLGAKAVGRLIRDQVPAGRFINAGPRYRAELIARTETLHAQRYSSLEVYRAADTIDAVMMHDNLTAFGDPECMGRDGQVVSFDDAETEMANEHPNGTLGFSPVVGSGTPS